MAMRRSCFYSRGDIAILQEAEGDEEAKQVIFDFFNRRTLRRCYRKSAQANSNMFKERPRFLRARKRIAKTVIERRQMSSRDIPSWFTEYLTMFLAQSEKVEDLARAEESCKRLVLDASNLGEESSQSTTTATGEELQDINSQQVQGPSENLFLPMKREQSSLEEGEESKQHVQHNEQRPSTVKDEFVLFTVFTPPENENMMYTCHDLVALADAEGYGQDEDDIQRYIQTRPQAPTNTTFVDTAPLSPRKKGRVLASVVEDCVKDRHELSKQEIRHMALFICGKISSQPNDDLVEACKYLIYDAHEVAKQRARDADNDNDNTVPSDSTDAQVKLEVKVKSETSDFDIENYPEDNRSPFRSIRMPLGLALAVQILSADRDGHHVNRSFFGKMAWNLIEVANIWQGAEMQGVWQEVIALAFAVLHLNFCRSTTEDEGEFWLDRISRPKSYMRNGDSACLIGRRPRPNPADRPRGRLLSPELEEELIGYLVETTLHRGGIVTHEDLREMAEDLSLECGGDGKVHPGWTYSLMQRNSEFKDLITKKNELP